MPKTPTDYSKTIIYKIQNIDNPELLYVGSTIDFTKRKSRHKSTCNNSNIRGYNYKLYQMIRDNGGWDMFNMIELYKFKCNNKREAECEEDKCIREMKSSLNMRRAYNTPEEKNERKKQYNLEHKDQIAERKKQYNLEHKDQIAEQVKQYYLEHKDKIVEQRKQKITCECGCIISQNNLARHKRSKTHQDLINKLVEN